MAQDKSNKELDNLGSRSDLSVGVVTVATNRYIDYWFEMALSAERYLFLGHNVVLHVFTDRVAEVKLMALQFSRITINVLEIDQLKWPEATLLRYEIFDLHRDFLQQDVLMHLDADMLVVENVGPELQPLNWPGGIALVQHPGYRRPTGRQLASLYGHNPRKLVSDVVTTVRLGGIGNWEVDPASRAFVPRSHRKRYSCGGTWMGLREPFLSMIRELAQRVRADLDEGIIAKWHDESHLNWFAAENETGILGSEYCYAAGLPNLVDLRPRILAVDKGNERTR